MKLYLKGQDIRKLSVGLIDGTAFTKLEEFNAKPEHFLSTLAKTLQDWDVNIETFDGIVLVNGPGSFTATRVSIAIANSLAFTHEMPILPIENPEYLDDEELLASLNLDNVTEQSHATVVYDRPAGITTPKNALGITK